ncbi:mitogen-activated protein kinase kinase kinase 18 [Manihot esculenta]|uniref:Protein kinase domain-containing protein n=2 Tax=Manihot esculenta TaxID=3983 RepID=A0A2C9V0V0_MANES|nr:mitogen-activated protein kinase kinase kinase 18 [Manihot esculenta]KAG8634340.1 hypothetical protein MANES_17G029024v8 [Manihot esculenta]
MDWTRGQTIGRGSTATVSVATFDHSGQVFAVKSAELSQSEFVQKEQSFLSALSCPQIVAYKGFDIREENGKLLYNIFLEYAPGGTLVDAIRKHGGRLHESVIRSYTRQILLGLHHLHSTGIVHRDIKGHNILVTGDGAKIADFGCARWVNEDLATNAKIAGTPVYMAPEVARGEHQGFPADVWALGCTILEMATGIAPCVNISDPVSALYQVGFSCYTPEIPSFMSVQAKDFLSKCLKRDPTERWSASELLEHAFITEETVSVLKDTDVDTPTSVLDQGLWGWKEDLKATWTWKSTHESGCLTPRERLGQLAKGSEKVPDWAWEETWVTVRSKSSAREIVASSNDCGLVHAKEATGELLHSGEYNLINVIANDSVGIGGISISNTSNSVGCRDNTIYKILSMYCICTKDYLRGSSNFEKGISFSVSTLQSLPSFLSEADPCTMGD